MSKEICENDLNEIEQKLWANAFVLIYDKGIQKLVGQAIMKAQNDQKILQQTGHKMNSQINVDKLIEDNSKEIADGARLWANNLIENYRKYK